jgi:heme ABC exporter ATP-binding subunit CcmA
MIRDPHGEGGAAALEIAGLRKSYGSLRVFSDLTFRCAAGESVAVLGPNGAGKSTLLRILAGMERPDSGRAVWRFGNAELSPIEARSRLGMTAPGHEPYSELTVEENLRFQAALRGIRVDRGRIPALLDTVGLDGRDHDRVETLSSGLRQRLNLAAAILHDPPFLLLDEPGSHLDSAGRTVLQTLVDSRLEQGAVVIIATNDPEDLPHAGQTVRLGGTLPGSRR